MRFITNPDGKVSTRKAVANALLPGAGYLVDNRPAEAGPTCDCGQPRETCTDHDGGPVPEAEWHPEVPEGAAVFWPTPEAEPSAPRCESCGCTSWTPDHVRAVMLGRLAKPVMICVGCGARRKLAHR